MDPEERKVQAAIHAVREAINTALTERQMNYNKLH
jgi:phenylalanyl-tRNA synthetase alpha chain